MQLQMSERQPAVDDWAFKVFADGSPEAASLEQRQLRLFGGDLFFPVCILRQSALTNNIEAMAEWCRVHDVSLAPHGKTTMAPQIVEMQLEAGAWGVTAATVAQARVFRASGFDRILLANELVDPGAIRWVCGELQDPRFDFYCLVDSVESLRLLASSVSGSRPVKVLVELGAPGGRTGCRSRQEATAVGLAVREEPKLELAGVECFEGILHGANEQQTRAQVTSILEELDRLAVDLQSLGAFEGLSEVVVSAGGSVYFDMVAELLVRETEPPRRVVLRSGCSVAHCSGALESRSPLATADRGRALDHALEVWGVALSRPEPQLALVGIGKRDVGFDMGLPIPLLAVSGEARRDVQGAISAVDINDQHLYLRVSEDDPLAVGDLVGCGITHPCTTFDRWRLIPVVDDDYRVVNTVRTYF
jgi:D-serine dehydratase